MKQILLIEDDPKICESLNNYFVSESLKLHTLSEGNGALETISQLKPDLILLDINLPGMSGFEILKGIKEKELKIPVTTRTAGEKNPVRWEEAVKNGKFLLGETTRELICFFLATRKHKNQGR